MPIDYGRYPADWPAIRQRILARATRALPIPGSARELYVPCCEWCGAPDRHWIVRGDPANRAAWRLAAESELLDDDGTPITWVVLTIAHLGAPHAGGTPGDKHDKHDVRDENLAALCQRCHLLYDMDDHVRHAAETRRRRRTEAGQLTIEGLEATG